jgi:hypothetical protein
MLKVSEVGVTSSLGSESVVETVTVTVLGLPCTPGALTVRIALRVPTDVGGVTTTVIVCDWLPPTVPPLGEMLTKLASLLLIE